jgi:hypothetical protein
MLSTAGVRHRNNLARSLLSHPSCLCPLSSTAERRSCKAEVVVSESTGGPKEMNVYGTFCIYIKTNFYISINIEGEFLHLQQKEE